MIKKAFSLGHKAALNKFALGPPTQVDQFIADVEQGKDVPPQAMTQTPLGPPPALDGTIPMQPPPSFGAGSTVAPELSAQATPPPMTMNPMGS